MATVISAREPEDLADVRRAVRDHVKAMGFSVLDQTRIGTASSELARNMVIYGGGGDVEIEEISDGGRRGTRLRFRDQGPGISDVDAALTNGFTTGSGLGLGLGGARRLMDKMDIETRVGEGTAITAIKWLR